MKTIEVEIPKVNSELDQDEEFFILKSENDRKIQFHDYQSIYRVPGLYEEVFHKQLKCRSPEVIAELLYKNVVKAAESFKDLNILDFGAGNGLVGKELNQFGPKEIVGVDIIPEARQAALRDRKGIYRDYFICDLAECDKNELRKLREYNFNAFVSVAALGFGHIPPKGFINAFNLVAKNGWVAINLRDRFLSESDESGFSDMLNFLKDRYIKILDKKTYQHRLSVSGEPIYYTAIVGRKLGDIKKSP
jgi:SAM-dependent methyltransferase